MNTPHDIARFLMQPNKGILAADESTRTMEKRFAPIGLEQTAENDRRYRQVLFTTPGIERYLSGVILHDETIRQAADTGTEFVRILDHLDIVPGIKVDLGLAPLTHFPGEEISRGIDTLETRLREYYEMGARFTKWRSVIHISDTSPSLTSLIANAHVLAQYAAMVQEYGMVPIVEPEVLYTGTHTVDRSSDVIAHTLATLFDTLAEYRVDLKGLILKTSMALPGKESGTPLDPPTIARETLSALRQSVPSETAGIVFLSGGQTPDQATANLNAIANSGPQPWPLTFSYSRAIEEPVIETWRGKDANIGEAQHTLTTLLQRNVAARNGTYTRGKAS